MISVGVTYPQIELNGDPQAVRQIALATEDLGYDHLLVYDHVLGAAQDGREPKLTGPYTENDPFHDPFVMFGYLAGITSRIELVTGVIILPQRQTALVAKQAADVDIFSGGRMRLGIGVGWNYVEYEALGQDFSTRGRRSAEQIDLIRQLWTQPLVTFDGEFDRVDRASIRPQPGRRIPIWLGGSSPAAFKRAGELGDGFIFSGAFEPALTNLARVRDELEKAGRSDADFGLQLQIVAADPALMAEQVQEWESLGGTHAGIGTMGLGLDTADAHVDFITRVRAALTAG
jgi:probable F420-dependent oxidoreductase